MKGNASSPTADTQFDSAQLRAVEPQPGETLACPTSAWTNNFQGQHQLIHARRKHTDTRHWQTNTHTTLHAQAPKASYRPPKRPRTTLLQTAYKPPANLLQTSYNPHTNLKQTTYKPPKKTSTKTAQHVQTT
jgi:hypothetical protein